MNSLPPEAAAEVYGIVRAAKRFSWMKPILAGVLSGVVTVFGFGWYLRGQVANIATKDDVAKLAAEWNAEAKDRKAHEDKQDDRLDKVEVIAAVAEFCCSSAHPTTVREESLRPR